jgi:anti-anti-sigma factor
VASREPPAEVVIALSGVLDRKGAATAGGLVRAAVLGDAPEVVIDLSGVDEIDGALLGVLVRATRWLAWRQRRLRIVCPREDLRRGLRVAGLQRHADVEYDGAGAERQDRPGKPWAGSGRAALTPVPGPGADDVPARPAAGPSSSSSSSRRAVAAARSAGSSAAARRAAGQSPTSQI